MGNQIIQNGNLKFILTPNKIAIDTGLQFFIIQPSEYCHTKRWQTLRLLIQLNEVRTIADIAHYSQNKLLFIPSLPKYLLDTVKHV